MMDAEAPGLSEHTAYLSDTNLLALLEVQFVIVGKLERLARRMPASDVLQRDGSGAAARRLAALDATSVEAWLRERCWTRDAVRLGALTVEMLLGVEPAQLSLLLLLQYIRANGSLSFLVEVEKAAQQWWVGGGGMGRVAPLLVEELHRQHGARLDARLGSPVRRVERLDGGRLCVCLGSGEALVAAHVLLALPPTACLERIELRPAPGPEWQRCAARAFMGCYTKCVVLYDAPFWRERGLSGTCMRLAWDAEHPVQNIYDHSEGAADAEPAAAGLGTPALAAAASRVDGHGPAAALVCFLAGDAAMLYAGAGAAALHEAVLRSLVRLLGVEARTRHLECLSYEWGADEWSRA